MLVPVYVAFAAAFVFFILVPVAGAVALRSQWRRFRDRVVELDDAPILTYRDVAGGVGRDGGYRLYGSVDAIEGPDRVWIRGPGVSALVDLSEAPVYTMPPDGVEAGSVKRLAWRRVSSVVEGARMYVGGRLVMESGRPVFVDAPGEKLICVIHDGDDEDLVSRLIVGGRSVNEYFGYATPLSIALGLIAISVILLVSRATSLSSVRALVFLTGALPALPFAPPGLFLVLAYRRLWKKALDHRIARDELRLSLRSGASPTGPRAASVSPAGELERRAAEEDGKAVGAIAASLLCLVLAVALNYALAFILWRAAL